MDTLNVSLQNDNCKKGTREMNANELADKLQTIRKSIWYDIDHVVAKFVDETTNEAATMLRQQQAEIEALNKFITDNTGRMEDYEVWKSIQK